MRILDWFKEWWHRDDWQPSKCFCPCGHEILQDPLSKIYEGGTFTSIICSKCNRQTTWDLDAPAPIFLGTKD